MEWASSPIGNLLTSVPNPELLPEVVTELWTTPDALSKRIKVLLPISHLPERLDAGDNWLRRIEAAVTDCILKSSVIVTSTGLSCWEITARIAARSGHPQLMILPPTRDPFDHLAHEIMRELNLDPNLVSFVMPIVSGNTTQKDALHIRDCLAAALSDVWMPIAIRKGGFWEGIMDKGRPVNHAYITSFPSGLPLSDYSARTISEKSQSIKWSNYLVHFTRGVFGPWPGERRSDYYDSLLERRESGNPRDEVATLSYILDSGLLRGGTRLFREKRAATSFTAVNPAEFALRANYHPGLHRRSFEPFGVALPKDLLVSLGVRPVIYGRQEDYLGLPETDRPFFQALGSKSAPHDWSKEAEWRLIGDLDLNSVAEYILIIVPDDQTRTRLKSSIRGKLIPLFTDPD